MTIDAHQHFWHYDAEKYGWIDDGMDVLKRNFLAEDLSREIQGLVEGVITVQAREDLDETQWLLDVAHDTPFVLGVVGWAPLAEEDAERYLEELSEHSELIGIRHLIQDETDDDFILRSDFNRGIERLAGFGLAYDILIFERHLPNTIRFVDRHPNQVFVLDHIAKPRIRDGQRLDWDRSIRALAKRENCYCKISGMVTEADAGGWTFEDLRPFLDTVLDAFGPERLMFGSDWPVCLLAAGYHRWYHVVDTYVSALSHEEQNRIWGDTAREAYRLVV